MTDHDALTKTETSAGFEVLMRRPKNYFKLSERRQWEIDDDLGALDIMIDSRFVTPEMTARWKEHFK